MGAWAARKANRVVVNVRRVMAMELLCGAQGIDLLRPLRSSESVEKIHQVVRDRVPYAEKDRTFFRDIEKLDELLKHREMPVS
jgi:histidine ammonia-lyase